MMGWLLFSFLPYFNLTLLFSILLANVHRFYCCLFGGKLTLGMCWLHIARYEVCNVRKNELNALLNTNYLLLRLFLLSYHYCNFLWRLYSSNINVATLSGGYSSLKFYYNLLWRPSYLHLHLFILHLLRRLFYFSYWYCNLYWRPLYFYTITATSFGAFATSTSPLQPTLAVLLHIMHPFNLCRL